MGISKKSKLFGLLSLYAAKQKSYRRRWWVRPIFQRRRDQGAFFNLVKELRENDPEGFCSYFRMTVSQFDYLAKLVGTVISNKNSNLRSCISVEHRLAITLRYLACGDSMASLSFSFRVARSTISSIISQVLDALWVVLQPIYLPEPNRQMWMEIAGGFSDKWQFPNCVGAIDGKHIVIQAPHLSGSTYYNYKGSYSIVLMAVADAHCKFVYVDIGAAGSQSDGGIFQHSTLGQKLANNSLCLPEPAPIHAGSSTALPFTFVGDEAFPLRLNIMRPFPGRHLGVQMRIFNYRLSRARRCVESAFGIMTARFRIFRQPIIARVETTEKIVRAAVCLHNFLKTENDVSPVSMRRYCPPGYADSDPKGIYSAGGWRNRYTSCLVPIKRVSTNSYGFVPASVRNAFCHYFNNEGAVSWQLPAVSAIE